MSVLLALDTSTNYGSIAIVQDERLAAELTWDVGRRHSQELLERVDELARMCHLTPSDLTAIAVALGPGSFNGVRVAVATGRSLALALGVPLYGRPTLDVIAFGHAGLPGTLYALLEAGRGDVYAARYVSAPPTQAQPPAGAVSRLADHLWRVSEYVIARPEQLADIAPPSDAEAVLFCGEWRSETRAALERAFGARAAFADALDTRRASWLAALVTRKGTSEAPPEPATIEPLYLRRPAITQSSKQPGLGDIREVPGERRVAAGEEGDARALRH